MYKIVQENAFFVKKFIEIVLFTQKTAFCSPTSAASPCWRPSARPRSWWACWTSCLRASTRWPTATTACASRSWATATTASQVCPSRAPTTPTAASRWAWTWSTPYRKQTNVSILAFLLCFWWIFLQYFCCFILHESFSIITRKSHF